MRGKHIAVLVAFVMTTSIACGIEKAQYEKVVNQRDELTKRLASLESEKKTLVAQVARLSQTDQAMWDELVNHQNWQRWAEVQEAAEELISRWPHSPLVSQAERIRMMARENISTKLYEEAQAAIKAESGELAKQRLQQLIEKYGETSAGRKAQREIGSLDAALTAASAARERQIRDQVREAERESSLLELTAFSWSTEHGYVTVEGMVRNISSNPLDNIKALAIFTDAKGDFISSADGLLEYRPILPRQSSPFKILAPANPLMKQCRIEFKEMFGSEIPTFHGWRKQ